MPNDLPPAPGDTALESLRALLSRERGGGPPGADWTSRTADATASRVAALRQWLDQHPDLPRSHPAVGLASAVLIGDLGTVAAHLRATTTAQLTALDGAAAELAEVRAALSRLAEEDDGPR